MTQSIHSQILCKFTATMAPQI